MARLSVPEYALTVAVAASLRSEDPFHKVGCALLREDNTIAAMGYNGPPPGVDIDWDDRDQRRLRVVHAEANALRYVKPHEVMLAATTMMPCDKCVLSLSSYGVQLIVYAEELDPTVYDVELVKRIAEEVGIPMYKQQVTG